MPLVTDAGQVYMAAGGRCPNGYRKRCVKKRKTAGAPKKRRSNASSPWIRALKQAGYLKKGSFAAIPKKGTAEYRRVKALM